MQEVPATWDQEHHEHQDRHSQSAWAPSSSAPTGQAGLVTDTSERVCNQEKGKVFSLSFQISPNLHLRNFLSQRKCLGVRRSLCSFSFPVFVKSILWDAHPSAAWAVQTHPAKCYLLSVQNTSLEHLIRFVQILCFIKQWAIIFHWLSLTCSWSCNECLSPSYFCHSSEVKYSLHLISFRAFWAFQFFIRKEKSIELVEILPISPSFLYQFC